MSAHYPTSEVYGSRALYGAIVAGAAFLLVATVSSFQPTQAPEARHVAKAPTTVETVVVTPGQST